MSDTIFAPLAVDELFITASEFRIADEPAKKMATTLSVTLDGEQPIDRERGCGLEQILTVNLTLADHEDRADVRMVARVTVRIVTTAADEVTDPNYQRASSLSIAYGHARSAINAIAAMSPMRGFIIPTVNPTALLRKLDERRGAE